MSILIRDPNEDAKRDAEYRAAAEKAMSGNGEWPAFPEQTDAEKEYAAGIASSENVIRAFSSPMCGMGAAVAMPMNRPGNGTKARCEADQPLDESFPSIASPGFSLIVKEPK